MKMVSPLEVGISCRDLPALRRLIGGKQVAGALKPGVGHRRERRVLRQMQPHSAAETPVPPAAPEAQS